MIPTYPCRYSRFMPGKAPMGVTTTLLLLALQVSGCASPSLGSESLLQETLHAQCMTGQTKHCSVWGGNKFQKRYEYCGCQKNR